MLSLLDFFGGVGGMYHFVVFSRRCIGFTHFHGKWQVLFDPPLGMSKFILGLSKT